VTERHPAMNARVVSAHIEADVLQGTDVLISIAVASVYPTSDESMMVFVDDMACPVDELLGAHGTRLHLLRGAPAGALRVDYQASVVATTDQFGADEVEQFHYLRPSRYCESDRLMQLAASVTDATVPSDIVAAVSAWVGDQVVYVSGSTGPAESATSTLISRVGVCRDFGHLVVALLRARDIPARIVSVYAPGLSPMDFHAVVEACIDGAWVVVDPTGLAPRRSMVRIATGVDASETAFLTSINGGLILTSMNVMATVDTELPIEDGAPTYLW
jgi:transglutaminase-like putative cysteine protease